MKFCKQESYELIIYDVEFANKGYDEHTIYGLEYARCSKTFIA
jgi:hypothetical protein